ncbi:MAG: hypothetical protein GF315_05920 [candidate division Zixibacteria bacterium]|nr:hypothetical protein [candidate division Zixibacteria bacterium]
MKAVCCYSILLLLLGFAVFLIGCSEDEITNGNGDIDEEAAQEKVDEADELLGDIMFSLINTDVEEPGDIDFSQPYSLYLEALDLDPTHSGANFGAGMLEVLMVNQDDEIQQAFDDWKNFIDADDYFVVGGPMSGPPETEKPTLRIDQAVMPLGMPLEITRNLCRMPNQDEPTVAELQSIFLSVVIPRINSAITYLSNAAEDDEFVFTVTGEMQGDYAEDPVELDLTEVYATLSGLNCLKALLYHFCAYNLSLEGYTDTDMIQALSQGSDFATLQTGGQSRMSEALAAWKSAASYLNSGITFLENESDYQGDDFIKIDPNDGLTQQNLDSLKHYIPMVQNALNSSETFTFYVNGENEDVEISLSSFFGSPVTDLKELFPSYEVSVDTQMVEWTGYASGGMIEANVEVYSEDVYYWYRYAEYEYGVLDTMVTYSNIDVPEFEAYWNDMVQSVDDNDFNVRISISFSDTLSIGTHMISAATSISGSTAIISRYVPVITWDADSFEEWILPDPTFGGLLPGMTDARFKELNDMSADGWEKTQTWWLW